MLAVSTCTTDIRDEFYVFLNRYQNTESIPGNSTQKNASIMKFITEIIIIEYTKTKFILVSLVKYSNIACMRTVHM